MKFTPRQDFVIVQMDEPVKQSKHGILLSPTVEEDRLPATVLAVGSGRVTDYGHFIEIVDLKVGDRIFFNKFSGLELDKDERLYLVRQSEIGCKITES